VKSKYAAEVFCAINNWITGLLGKWSYKTHKGSFVKIHYPWHPLYHCEVQVLNLIHRGGESFYSIRLSDASCLFVPSWMTDEAYCQCFVLAQEAHCSMQALLRLRQLLDTLALSGGK